MTTTRTHCIVCFNCRYVSDPMSERRSMSLVHRLNDPDLPNCIFGGHDVEVLTVAAGTVAQMLWDDDDHFWDDVQGEGPF